MSFTAGGRYRQGLTLLEVQVSLLLLLLVSLYLMSLFASGQRHARRALDYSRATILAHRRLEEARATPVAELSLGLRQEGEPNPGFNTTLRVNRFETGLWLLEVETRAPSGALARATSLVADPSQFVGVAGDVFVNRLSWINGGDLMAWDELTSTATNLGPVADGRRFGGLAGQPGTNLLWRGGRQQGPVSFFESLPTPTTWGIPLGNPVPAPDNFTAEARFTGLASDQSGSYLVAADAANGGLWFNQDGSWAPLTRPTNPPLGRPSGLCCDPAISLVWVADQDYQCLRKLVSPAGAAGYPAAALESAGPLGSWHRTRFRPPATMTLGSPMGLAMDPQGHAVYLHDRARLYRFIDGATPVWEMLGQLPPALIAQVPSGLATDRFGNQLYLATESGALWKVRAATSLNSGDFRQLWP